MQPPLDTDITQIGSGHPVILYDGNCRMCSGFVRFVLRRDKRERFRFIAAQSSLGARIYRHYGLDAVNYETNILLEDGQAWLKSESSIRIFERLGFPWSMLAIGRLLPLPIRDALYEVIARNRFRWFGVRKTCYLLEPEQESRFLG